MLQRSVSPRQPAHESERGGKAPETSMKTQVEKLPHSRVALEIEVEPERVEEALDQAYRRIVRRIDVPGFRRGRAPRAVVERRIGRESLLHEALDDLLPAVFSQAIEETGINPLGTPTFDWEDEKKGSPFILKAEVDVKPDVQLGEYRGLKAEKLIEDITDDHVDEVLADYQRQLTQLVEPEDRDVAEMGDVAVIDFDGTIDGEPFQGGAARDYMLELGSESFPPGFEDQIVGMQVDEERTVTITFPEEGYPQDLQGKEAVFQVTLKELKAKHIPDIDDELAKEAGEADTLEEWKASIRQRLEEQAMEAATTRLQNELVRQVVEASELELPRTLVNAELQLLLEQLAYSLAMQGFSLESYLKASGRSMKDITDELTPRAENRVRTFLVLDAIADRESITPTDEEIREEMERMGLLGEDGDPSSVDEDRRADIIDALRSRKVLELLEAEAEVTERRVDAEELRALTGDGDDDETEDDEAAEDSPVSAEEEASAGDEPGEAGDDEKA